MRFMRGFHLAFIALLALVGASLASPSQAQAQGTIQISILKGGWFIGGSAGSGTLRFHGRSYPFNIGGLSAGLVFGGSVTEFVGEVHNIRIPRDINGVYSAIGTGAAVAGGVRLMELRNANGVRLTLRGRQVGLLLNLDLSGMSISLK